MDYVELTPPLIDRMIDVIMDHKAMCLVFEYMDMDLKKYMDITFPGEQLMDMQVVKVNFSYNAKLVKKILACSNY